MHSRVATKSDIDRLDSKVDSLDSKLDSSVARLDKKIDGLDGRVGSLEKKLDQVEKRLDKKIDDVERNLSAQIIEVQQGMGIMAQTIQQELDKKVDKDYFDQVVANLATKDDINKILNILDRHTAILENHEIEQAAIKSQLSRHERWHHEAAEHTGYKLTSN